MSFTQMIQDKLDALVVSFNKPSLDEKANFFRLLSVSQKAGLGIRDALQSLLQGEKNKGMLLIIEQLIEKVSEGTSLANAMESQPHFFASDEIELIRSTEITGSMVQTLEEIAVNLEASQEINAKVKKAATYPVMMIGLTIVAVAVLLIKVFPTIVGMYEGIELPGITQFCLDASDFLQLHWYKLALGIAAVVFLYKTLYSKWLLFKIGIDKLLLILPVVGNVVRLTYMSKFASLLAQFYEAGVSPVVSFKLLASIFDNFHYKRKMIEIRNSINAGFSIYDSLEGTDLFDPVLVQIINVGENTGSLPSVLSRIAPFYETTLKNSIDSLMSMLEPAIMGFIAGIVGVLLGAIYIPMADMVNVIS